jgi:SAM-dependent methyltransferase
MQTKVQPEISPNDTMYEGNREHYFSVGHSALDCIQAAMLAANKSNAKNILDFASGYGRVLRVLKAAFPAAELTACDISRDAIEFCAKALNARPLLSSENPADIRFGTKFDLIWCGTLLTCLDAPEFFEFLKMLHSALSPDGLLVFTTHGPFVAEQLRTTGGNYGLGNERRATILNGYDASGFGYADYPSEILPGVGVKKYGFCVAKPSWVCRHIESLPDARLISYTEQAWDNHQDAIACAKR